MFFPTNLPENGTYLQSYFIFSILPPEPIGTPKVSIWRVNPNLMSYFANQPKNRSYLQIWFIFPILYQFWAPKLVFAPPLPEPISTKKVPIWPCWPCSPNIMSCPTNQPKKDHIYEFGSFFSIFSHCKTILAQYLAFFGSPLPPEAKSTPMVSIWSLAPNFLFCPT